MLQNSIGFLQSEGAGTAGSRPSRKNAASISEIDVI